MARTRRHIPYWVSDTSYERCWNALYELGYYNKPFHDDTYIRSELYNGYDGSSQSHYYSNFMDTGYKENYQKKTRAYFKRRVSKMRRRYGNSIIDKEISDEA